MPDDPSIPDLPPLQPMPESNITPDMIGQLEHSADWASTFGGGDTNIALRARHNQDISNYANALAAQRQTAQANLLQSNKAAQDLYFGMQRMNMQQTEAQQRMQAAAELHPLTMQAKQAQIDADLAREKASTISGLTQSAKAQALAEQQATADSDTLKFVQGEQALASQFGRNTQDYHNGLLDLHAATPAGDQQFKAPYVAAAIKATGKADVPDVDPSQIPLSKMTPEQRIAATQAAMINNSVALEFGHKNDKGALVPDTTPGAQATHLNVRFTGPDGKIHDSGPMTIAEYQALHQQVKAPVSVAPPPAASAAATPQSFDSPEEFTSAFKAAKPGEIIHYKGKPYTKPGA